MDPAAITGFAGLVKALIATLGQASVFQASRLVRDRRSGLDKECLAIKANIRRVYKEYKAPRGTRLLAHYFVLQHHLNEAIKQSHECLNSFHWNRLSKSTASRNSKHSWEQIAQTGCNTPVRRSLLKRILPNSLDWCHRSPGQNRK